MRRICAGDWVRFVGQSASVRGLGKVIEGDYDPADNALRAARVEFARLALWVLPSDLRRIGPEEEMRLVLEAVEHVLMPESAANRIREALRDPERLNFVRSPGFLDLLWNLMGSLPGERAVNGLARFFDEGEISWKPAPAPTPAPVVAAPEERRRPLRSLPRGTVRARALVPLDRETLCQIAGRGGLTVETDATEGALYRKVLDSDIGLEAILIPLDDEALDAVVRALGLDPSGNGAQDTARILALAANEHDVPRSKSPQAQRSEPPPSRDARPFLPKSKPPRVPTGTVLERMLETLNHIVLVEVAKLKSLELTKGTSARNMNAGELRQKLVESKIELVQVLGVLTENQLAQAARAVGVAESDSTSITKARILAVAAREDSEAQWVPDATRVDLPSLPAGTVFAGVVATLDREALLMIATLKYLVFDEDEPVESLRSKVYTSKIELRTVLAALSDGQLAQAAHALEIYTPIVAKRADLKKRLLALAANEASLPAAPPREPPTTAPPPAPLPAQIDPKLILERFDIDTIFALALAHPAPPGVPAGSPSDLRTYLATAGLDMVKLVHGLTLEQLQRAARNSGLSTEGTADELATRILGGGAPSPRLVDSPTDW
jgi:hypothetical protein